MRLIREELEKSQISDGGFWDLYALKVAQGTLMVSQIWGSLVLRLQSQLLCMVWKALHGLSPPAFLSMPLCPLNFML